MTTQVIQRFDWEHVADTLSTSQLIQLLNARLPRIARAITSLRMYSGVGSPNNVITAPVGSLYERTDGGASTTLYVKESGTGAAGWVAK